MAIPPLGWCRGGLDWAEVRPRTETALSAVPDVEAYLFEPGKQRLRAMSTADRPPPESDLYRLAALVRLCRIAQADYFRDRTTARLRTATDLERRVDELSKWGLPDSTRGRPHQVPPPSRRSPSRCRRAPW